MLPRLVVVVVVTLVLVGSISASGADGGAIDPGPDYQGWEDGYRFDDGISVDWSDGLNDSELDAVVSRAMARVEEIRELEFRENVSVEVVNRTTFEQRELNRTVTPALRTFDNAKFEALFLVNETTDSISVQQGNSANSVRGYYSIERETIVLVAEDGETPHIDEFTLAHELVHALQDQHFNLSSYDARTRDARHAQDGLIEGDAAFVEYRYRSACADRWSGMCGPTGDTNGGELTNFGVYLLTYFPYSDGPAFVRHLYDRGGWDAVNAAYENPPVSSEQVIHPGAYPGEIPSSHLIATASPTAILGSEEPQSPSRTAVTASGTPTRSGNDTASPEPTRNGTSTTTGPTGTSDAGETRSTPGTPTTATATELDTSTPTSAPTASTDTPLNSTTTASHQPTATEPPTRTNAGNGTAESPTAAYGLHPPVVPVEGNTTATPTTVPIPPDRSEERPTDRVVTTTETEAIDEWQRVRPEGRPDQASMGEAAIAVMFFYPTYHSGGDAGVIPGDAFFNSTGRELSEFDPFVYDQPYSEGWNGDRLTVYRNTDNQTGYIWQLSWDTPEDAREFAQGYDDVLRYWGAEQIGTNTYHIPDGGFDDVFNIHVVENRVTIVNAPSTSQILPVYTQLEGVDPGDAEERLHVDLTVGENQVTTEQPGFGVLPGIIGVMLAVLLGIRRSG